MLTTRQTDTIMISLGTAACIAFVLTMLLNQTEYWLLTSAIGMTLAGTVAMMHYFSEEDPE